MGYADFDVHREFEEFSIQLPSDDSESVLDDGMTFLGVSHSTEPVGNSLSRPRPHGHSPERPVGHHQLLRNIERQHPVSVVFILGPYKSAFLGCY
jgi:hypothetical protein